MVGHRGTPGMENRRDPNLGPQVLRITRDPDHRVSTCPHQQVVDLAFVLMRDVGDGFGQGEYKMEIPHGQQFSLTCP